MIGEIRQNFTEASTSVGLILATALEYAELFTWTFWTCASQMKSGILDILDPRPVIFLASTTDPKLSFLLMAFYTSERECTCASLSQVSL